LPSIDCYPVDKVVPDEDDQRSKRIDGVNGGNRQIIMAKKYSIGVDEHCDVPN
jgi:hypothetical protein